MVPRTNNLNYCSILLSNNKKDLGHRKGVFIPQFETAILRIADGMLYVELPSQQQYIERLFYIHLFKNLRWLWANWKLWSLALTLTVSVRNVLANARAKNEAKKGNLKWDVHNPHQRNPQSCMKQRSLQITWRTISKIPLPKEEKPIEKIFL